MDQILTVMDVSESGGMEDCVRWRRCKRRCDFSRKCQRVTVSRRHNIVRKFIVSSGRGGRDVLSHRRHKKLRRVRRI